jgi:AraC-like DNA-binding protein
MGRPSKLTEKQWASIGERLLKGEKAADLAREFGVSKTRISARFSERTGTVKTVANQLVAAESALRALPLSEQVSVLTLADELRAISMHLAGAAKFGSATAHRLSGIAHAKVQEIDDAAPLTAESLESLKGVAVLSKMANEAAVIPTALLTANKDYVKELNTGASQSKDELLREIAANLPN